MDCFSDRMHRADLVYPATSIEEIDGQKKEGARMLPLLILHGKLVVVCRHTMLSYIESFVFFLFINTHTQSKLEDVEDDE